MKRGYACLVLRKYKSRMKGMRIDFGSLTCVSYVTYGLKKVSVMWVLIFLIWLENW